MDDLTILRERVREANLPVREIAERAGVTYRWLRAMMMGSIPEPGYTKVRRVQRVMANIRRSRRPAA